jgi:uncharacterized OB-fold protein
MATQVPIAAGLFTWPADEPQLLGSRCPECSNVAFPSQQGCPRCGHDGMSITPLARRGTVWTWTTQGFRPKHPYNAPGTDDTFEPFVLGYVELPGEVRVESQLLTTRDDVHIGMEVELVIVPFRVDDDGNEIVTFAFAPVTA